MLGEKIKQLRMEKGLTQKELADQLYVTAQAVSRWENNEVEPSVATLTSLSKILGVSVGELVGESAPQPQVVVKKEVVYKEQKPVLAVCEKCNKPIYEATDIVREKSYDGSSIVRCKKCDIKYKQSIHQSKVSYGVSQRTKAFVWGAIATVAALILSIVLASTGVWDSTTTIVAIVASIALFPFISCLFLKNNFIGNMVEAVASWGYITFPGLIFTLDLDGILWLITVKITFWLIGVIIGTLCTILAVLLGMALSIFVYPFALAKNIRHPEETEED